MNIRKVLYAFAALFLAGWALGFFVLQAGTIIHIFIMAAAILWMRAIMINPKQQPPELIE